MMRLLMCALTLGLALPALADNRALVIGNGSYRNATNLSGAAEALTVVPALEAAGFSVLHGRDMTTEGARALLSALLLKAAPGDRLVILLTGHFVRSDRGTWFLGTEARRPDLANAGAAGIDLGAVLEIAARAPGGAVVLLGTEERRIELGTGLTPGIADLEVPQGVTLIRGDARAVAAFAGGAMLAPGVSLSAAAEGRRNMTAEGFLSPLVPFLPAAAAAPAPAPGPAPVPGPVPADPELTAWRAAQMVGTIQGYADYLSRYPQGRFADQARAERDRLQQAQSPAVRAQAAEEALALTRDQRRELQRALSLLGHDPRGIDGLFGPGTRAAVTAWQRANTLNATGFLDRDQITRLQAQADRRAAELEAEARTRRAEQERQDRAYWEQTGAAGDEAGLRAYLGRHPDGLFADVAQARLDVFEEQRRGQVAARDRSAWERAEATDTAEAYRIYLAEFPQGAWAEAAQRRIARITGATGEAPPADTARYQAAEAALNLNAVTRNLIEQRLDAGGYNPGRVDGVFDAETRGAIRRFQRARNLPVTGYMTEALVVQLMADALRGGRN